MRRLATIDRNQIASFSATSDFPDRLLRAFALVIDWAAAASGLMHLDDVLIGMGRLVGGSHLSVYRISTKEYAPQLVAQVDRREGNPPAERITGALMQFVVNNFPDEIVPGKIVRLTTLKADPQFLGSPAFKEWNGRDDFANVSLMILGENAQTFDVLEIRYSKLPEIDVDIPTAVLGVAISDAWGLRSPGYVLGLISKFGAKHRKVPTTAESHILGPDNPYALSHSQLRVCQLLGAGQKAAGIAELMGISITTVRSHLRNIYIKTNTTGQFEVIALINRTASHLDSEGKPL